MLDKYKQQEKIATNANSNVHCCECNKVLAAKDQAGVENEYCEDCQRKYQQILDTDIQRKAAS
ncbi:hypothetical protein BFP76_12095 [Amylibacter kogurei]|uniref:Uncharacterized protein n=1 Tax=Paramylibacter kogurei TaxID=1889778 RepID=A0A2G5KAT0_9RHOB|nr:hypothetical protein [Amylibacter kogurei]PIB26626.1 hypothetical protein BFP76_12095 [Amylibacter kogurei]